MSPRAVEVRVSLPSGKPIAAWLTTDDGTHLPIPHCEVCGCTEARACPGGCAWSPTHATVGRAVCTACVGKAGVP